VSQVIKVLFSRDLDFDEVIDLWRDRGVARRISQDVVEMMSTLSSEIMVVEFKRDARVLDIHGGVSEDAWSWIEQLSDHFDGTVSGEHTEAASFSSLSFRSLAPHWRVAGVIIAILLLPLTVVVGLFYAGVQIARLAMKAKRL